MFRKLLILIPFAAATLAAANFPDPPAGPKSGARKEKVVLAGGCFWGVEGVYDRVKGVSNAVSGYAGGQAETAQYEIVSTGRTGHAESVEVTYDPNKISFGTILKIFFSVVHDPTQLNRQEYDVGTQYRSAIFYTTPEQKQVAEAYIKQLEEAHVFPHKIVTQVTALPGFYRAEDHHQHYLDLHPTQPYIARMDMPKIQALHEKFPELVSRK